MNKQITLIAFGALLVGILIGYALPFNAVNKDSMSGMHDAMDGMMQGLEGKKGDALDKAFLDEMIVHHEGALSMAQALLAGTERPELIELGNAIIAAQTREIQQMKSWQSEWFGN